mmetsp:Transcript_251/g.238  ORF Transcript_251/g.238 Transcript_251/m.238 type:complete len:154 (-) Transcript_251:558-1019(-)
MIPSIEGEFYDDENSDSVDHLHISSFQKLSTKLQNDGYRMGKQIGEESLTQQQFDAGFRKGMLIGKTIGKFYGKFIYFSATQGQGVVDDKIKKQIDSILFSAVPGGLSISEARLQIVNLLSSYHEYDHTVKEFLEEDLSYMDEDIHPFKEALS